MITRLPRAAVGLHDDRESVRRRARDGSPKPTSMVTLRRDGMPSRQRTIHTPRLHCDQPSASCLLESENGRREISVGQLARRG